MNHFSPADHVTFRRMVTNVAIEFLGNFSVQLTCVRSESLGLCRTTFRQNVSVIWTETCHELYK